MAAVAWAMVLATLVAMEQNDFREMVAVMMLCISTLREWFRK